MIWSKYNELIKKQDDSFFLFNSRTKKWLTLVRELYVLLSDNYKNIDEISTIHPELFETLVKEKVLTSKSKLTSEDFYLILNLKEPKENQENRLDLIKHMMSSFLDGVDAKNREDFFQHLEEMLEVENRNIKEDRLYLFEIE